MVLGISERRIIEINTNEVSQGDLIRVTFVSDADVYLKWNGSEWLIDRELAPPKIWETATRLHGERHFLTKRLTPDQMHEPGRVKMTVGNSGSRTLQLDDNLVIEYSFPAQNRKVLSTYGSSCVCEVHATRRDEIHPVLAR